MFKNNARWLRLLVPPLLVLIAVNYFFGFILDASMRRWRYTLMYNKPTILSNEPRHGNSSHAKTSTRTKNTTNSLQDLTRPKSEEDNFKNLFGPNRLQYKNNETEMPLCDSMPPGLGPIPVDQTATDLEVVEKKYPEVQWGGRYSPPACTARHKVAIIVPFRDRWEHLAIFLNHMHPFLMKQQIEYGIFIVEPEGNVRFNRAKLMNVGFAESQKQKAGGWRCFIFHDVDLLPLDERNLYSCPRQPRHMSASLDSHGFKLLYEELFGGVTAMTLEQFKSVNGYSNRYWGWGAEDDDMYSRLKEMNYSVGRYKMSIARYIMLVHGEAAPNPVRRDLLRQSNRTFKLDGLSTLEYTLVDVVRHHLYTHVIANITEQADGSSIISLNKYTFIFLATGISVIYHLAEVYLW